MKPTDQVQWNGVVDSWLAQDTVGSADTDPVSGTVLVDTGELSEGWYDIRACITGDSNHYYIRVEHRNAANTGNLFTTYLTAFAYSVQKGAFLNWKVEENQRVRLIVSGNATGKFISGLMWVKRA